MRTSFHLLFFLGATVAWPLAAQEQARPLRELVETVERQTGLRVVGDPAVLDSTLVTPSAGGTDPIQALSDALRPAKLYVVRYEGDLIISGAGGYGERAYLAGRAQGLFREQGL